MYTMATYSEDPREKGVGRQANSAGHLDSRPTSIGLPESERGGLEGETQEIPQPRRMDPDRSRSSTGYRLKLCVFDVAPAQEDASSRSSVKTIERCGQSTRTISEHLRGENVS
jgi:hypothetical protein